MQYGMIIDLERCVGCHACTMACRGEWNVPLGFERNWVRRMGPTIVEGMMTSTYYPGLCNHCTNPTCVEVCPADTLEVTFTDKKTGETLTEEIAATWKDPFDGLVLIDKNRCIGCGACVEACPYGARYINEDLVDDVSEDGKADKCTYCAPRLEQGLEPACVQTCITGARIFGDLDDPESEVAKYVAKGAVGIEPADAEEPFVPNSRYYGNERDMALLMDTQTPEMASIDLLKRKTMIAAAVRPLKKQLKGLGVAGLIGAAAIQRLTAENSPEESK